ncbi:cutinase family protein [Dactylosporangium sp. CA-152071]|uniref:cutinase family protein n=1 Tax=Dactylosporangium sp. CA-152071 TaxID=3239933 RepID=UPI003D8B7C07
MHLPLKPAVLLCAALAAVLPAVAPVGAAPAAAHAPVCDDLVEVIAFRGSGEDQNTKDGEAHEWMGPRLKGIVDEARTMTTSDGVNLNHAPVWGVPLADYPAIPLEDYLNLSPLSFKAEPAKMLESAGKGGTAAWKHMVESRRACPGRRFVLLGYSQGATAARIALKYTPDSWIAGTFLIGDPELHPGAGYAKGTGATGGGGSLLAAYRTMGGDVDALLPDQLAGRKFATYSFCHVHDPVCDARLLWNSDEHTNYGVAAAERRTLATVIVDMYRTARNNPPPATEKVALDVVFAIDTTGSMTPYITNARSSAASIADKLRTSSSSFQVGLAEYRDHGDEFVARVVTPLTGDATAFRSGLDKLIAAGGGDTPEAVYSGMITAAGVAWRPTARRVVIVIGDAPAHDPEAVTGYTRDDVVKAFNAAGSFASAKLAPSSTGPIRLYGLAADTTLQAQLSAIATETGGEVAPIGDPADVAAKILESLADATSAPVVTLGVPAAFAGVPTTMTATDANAAAGLTYEWDVDGDGTADETTATGQLTHTYAKAGSYKVTVRVKDGEGHETVATATQTVTAAPGVVTVPLGGPSEPPGSATPTAPATTPPATPSGTPASPVPATTPKAEDQLGRTGSNLMPLLYAGFGLIVAGAALLVTIRRRRLR